MYGTTCRTNGSSPPGGMGCFAMESAAAVASFMSRTLPLSLGAPAFFTATSTRLRRITIGPMLTSGAAVTSTGWSRTSRRPWYAVPLVEPRSRRKTCVSRRSIAAWNCETYGRSICKSLSWLRPIRTGKRSNVASNCWLAWVSKTLATCATGMEASLADPVLLSGLLGVASGAPRRLRKPHPRPLPAGGRRGEGRGVLPVSCPQYLQGATLSHTMSLVQRIPPMISALAFGYGVGMAAPEATLASVHDAVAGYHEAPRVSTASLPPVAQVTRVTASGIGGDESRELSRLREIGARDAPKEKGESCELDRPLFSKLPHYESRMDRDVMEADDLDSAGAEALSRLQ